MRRRNSKVVDPILKVLLRLASPLKSIAAQTADGMVFIRPERIAYMTFDNQRLVIRELDGSTWYRFDSLNEMEQRLAEDPRFFRSHRSYIVNLYAVRGAAKAGSKNYELYFDSDAPGRAGLANSKVDKFRDLMEMEE